MFVFHLKVSLSSSLVIRGLIGVFLVLSFFFIIFEYEFPSGEGVTYVPYLVKDEKVQYPYLNI